MTEKGRPLHPEEDFGYAAERFHWAFKEHYTIWLHGKLKRDGPTERWLKKSTDRGKLVARKYKGTHRLAYANASRGKVTLKDLGFDYPDDIRLEKEDEVLQIDNGLQITDALIRFHWSLNVPQIIIPESEMKGKYIVPEFAVWFPETKNFFAYEYFSRNGFYKVNRMLAKLHRYFNHFETLRSWYAADSSTVLFDCDVHRYAVQGFLRQTVQPLYEQYRKKTAKTFELYFVDHSTFLDVPFGEQYTSQIYIWAGNGKVYPLVKRA